MKTRNPTRGGTSDDNNEELAAVVEEIWMDKKPGRPTERVRSNRIYVVEPDRAGRLTCQDTRKVGDVWNCLVFISIAESELLFFQ